ncbi:serine hydrolase [Aquimarina sp. 2304DJ70-9]|uniref:serine hydrolase n=1 Tax=Aquimarina penaris TaxID=3231044 RepID=UPI0034622D74
MKLNLKHTLKKVLFISIFIQLITLSFTVAQTKTEQIDILMNLYHEYGQFNGSALVAENGKVIYKKGLGFANMEWDITNQPDTKHRLGSITKQFTSMLIMQLVEQGKLKLDVPITTYLTDYPKSSGDKITIHHLLTHTAGIPSYTSFPKFFKDHARNPYTPDEFVKVFKDSTLQFTPGEKFAYSNSGYFLLGVIIEKVSGKTYEQMLQKNIFTPLKMNNTGFDHHRTILKNRATGYSKFGTLYTNSGYLDMSIPYAAGSMYSTVEDLYLWDQALYTDQLISKKSKDLIFTPDTSTGKASYGYGWGINHQPLGKSNDSIKVIGHSGGINGFNTIISRIPSDKHLIVLLNNTGRTDLKQMSRSISSILYGAAYDNPKKSVAFSLLGVIMDKGISSGLEEFEKIKASETYALDEIEMNRVGYQLIRVNKVKEAIEVFRLNVASFPESGNAYDSLGEAYLKDGNKELAIKNYKKSVEIDPNNTNGAKVLKELQSE